MTKYKIITGGYNEGTYDNESSAMKEANRLSYHYDKVIVRLVHANGRPVQMADDRIVQKGVISFRPKLLIKGLNIII